MSSADLLRRLIEAGTPADLVAEVAMLAAGSVALSRRRESDAARKQAERARAKAAAGEVPSRDVTGCHATSQDIADEAPLSLPPNEINSNPPAHTPVCESPVREAPPAELVLIPAEPATDVPSEAVDAWNAMAGRTGLAPVRKLTPERRNRIMARIREHGPDAMTEAISAVERSRFCRGRNQQRWRADFDFLLQPSSFVKLLEGSYDPANDHHDQPEIANPMVRAVAARRARRAGQTGFGAGV